MSDCKHDNCFDLPCGEQQCPDCGETIEVTCDNAEKDCAYCNAVERLQDTRPASPALDRLKEEIEGAEHDSQCTYIQCIRAGNSVSAKRCTCFKSRAMRIIEELKHE